MRRIRVCQHCGKAFLIARTGRPALGCSTACRKAIQRNRQAGNKAAYKSKPFFRQCDYCLQLFEVFNHARRRFCNRACAGKFRKWDRLAIPVAIKEKVMRMLEAA